MVSESNFGVREADTDGDGFTNLQEQIAGTDPLDSASALRITSITVTGNDVFVTWTAGGGKTNFVQTAPAFTTNFNDLSPWIILPGTGDVITNYLDIGGATNTPSRFYRIRLAP